MKRYLNAVLLVMAACFLCVAVQAGQGRVKVTLSGQPVPHGLPIYVGIEKGWFAEEGLDVDVLVYVSGPPQMEAVPSNAWQVASPACPPPSPASTATTTR